MLGNKSLSEIRKEVSKRLKAAGVDEEQLRAMLRQLKPVKRKSAVTVKSMLGQSDSTNKKKRRAVSNAR